MDADKKVQKFKFKLTKQELVGISLIFEGETTITDVVQVFKPFKEGHSHTTSIDIHVLQRNIAKI